MTKLQDTTVANEPTYQLCAHNRLSASLLEIMADVLEGNVDRARERFEGMAIGGDRGAFYRIKGNVIKKDELAEIRQQAAFMREFLAEHDTMAEQASEA